MFNSHNQFNLSAEPTPSFNCMHLALFSTYFSSFFLVGILSFVDLIKNWAFVNFYFLFWFLLVLDVGNSAFLFLAIYALTPDMILYLMKEYHMDMASGSNVLYLWSAALNFTPVIGALMADSFVGRFQMIGLGSGLCLLVRFFTLKSILLIY